MKMHEYEYKYKYSESKYTLEYDYFRMYDSTSMITLECT